MAFKTNMQISGNPEFGVNVKIAPLDFQLGGEGLLAFSTKPIRGQVDQIPIKVRVPFMAHNHGYVAAAMIGSFGVNLHEIDATVRALGVHVSGVLGKDGIEADLAGEVRCCMKVDVNAQLPGKMVEAAIKAVFDEE